MNQPTAGVTPDFDAIVIGAGITGIYSIYRLREMGMTSLCLEAGTGVGGTWYWNRYPGARFDSESYSYGFSFSEELLQEWEWSEKFAPQPETLRYLNFVADKFDLRRDMRFSQRVTTAHYNEAANLWHVETEDGTRVSARFVITGVGGLSAPYIPDFKDADKFTGESWHTSTWPHHEVDLSNKRVGVIGTGATAVQMITEVAKSVGDLTVFQRTPNYCKPLRNGPIDEEFQKEIKASYPEIFEKCRNSFGGFIHDFHQQSALDVSAEEREAFFEKSWNEPGFGFWLGSYSDILTNHEANEIVAKFVRKKIRARIKDPAVADMLIPTSYAFGTKRVPLESGYFEAYNRDNVHLIDVKKSPIECFTETGIKTGDAEFEFDVIIYATGFDAVTGTLNRIDIRGKDGLALKDKWADGPSTQLGMLSVGFPNLFMVGGPHNASSFCNVPRCLEQNVEWITDCIEYLREHKHAQMEATPDAEAEWTQHVLDSADATLFPETDSWFMGANIPGKKRVFLNYVGGVQNFRAKCDEVATNGYEGFKLG